MRYNKKLAQELADLYESGEYTIREICAKKVITAETWYDWKRTKPEFSELIEMAYSRRLDNMAEMAEKALAVRLKPYEYDEVKTEYEAPKKTGEPAKVLSQTRTRKVILPDTRLIQFALTNRKKNEWKNTQNIDHTTGGEALSFGSFLMQASTPPAQNDNENQPAA